MLGTPLPICRERNSPAASELGGNSGLMLNLFPCKVACPRRAVSPQPPRDATRVCFHYIAAPFPWPIQEPWVRFLPLEMP